MHYTAGPMYVVFTCDEETCRDQGHDEASCVLVGSGFCWRKNCFCSLKERSPVKEGQESSRVLESALKK